MFLELGKTPKNPRHFVALCFMQLKLHPELRDQNFFMRKVCEKKNKALFRCAYGYFWVDKSRVVLSETFLLTWEEVLKTSSKTIEKPRV